MKTYEEAVHDLASRKLDAMCAQSADEWWGADYGRKYYNACADEIAAIYTDDFNRFKVADDVKAELDRLRAALPAAFTADLYEDDEGNLHMFALRNGAPVWGGVYDIDHVIEAATDWRYLLEGEDPSGWKTPYSRWVEVEEAHERILGAFAARDGRVFQIASSGWAFLNHGFDPSFADACGKAFGRALAGELEDSAISEGVFTVETYDLLLVNNSWLVGDSRRTVLVTDDKSEALSEFDAQVSDMAELFDYHCRSGRGLGMHAMESRGYAVDLWQRRCEGECGDDDELLDTRSYDMHEYTAAGGKAFTAVPAGR